MSEPNTDTSEIKDLKLIPPIQHTTNEKSSGLNWQVAFIFICAVCGLGLIGISDMYSPSQPQNEDNPLSQAPAPAPSMTEPTNFNAQQKSDQEARAEIPEQVDAWQYESVQEDMGRGAVQTATVISENTINLDFPYEGEQRATLQLRIHPKHGKDVILSIEKGQLLIDSFQGTTIPVRFDDRKIIEFIGRGAADLSSEYVFLSNFERFLTNLKGAKRVRIEVPIYQAGSQTFEFNVENFNKRKLYGTRAQ